MEQILQPSCPVPGSQRNAQLQVSAVVVLLVCAVTSSWGFDTDVVENGQGDAGDGVVVPQNPVDDGQTDNQVLKVLETDTKAASSGDLPCWMTESFTTQGPCQACDEYSMNYASYCCRETGFRQLVRCETSTTTVYKSCPKSQWAMEKSFWTFEGVMLAVGLSSFAVVLFRRRALDWEALQRVKKQIANSV